MFAEWFVHFSMHAIVRIFLKFYQQFLELILLHIYFTATAMLGRSFSAVELCAC